MQPYRIIAMASVSLVSLATPAFAQQAATSAAPQADQGFGENDIIVTARRREEDVQDVPQVINAVTPQQLQKLNIRDVIEVQTLVPGLQLRNEANGIGGSAQLRGIQYDVNTSAAPTVAFYQNDAPVEASMVLQTMFDIGQITVERGPQGTLRGVSAPSGAITVTTRKPDLESYGGYVQATANDIGTGNINAAVGGPIIPGKLAVRIAGAWDQQELNRVTTFERDGDARDPYARNKSGRASVLATPTDWLRLEGVYQKVDRYARTFAQYESFSLANPAAAASNPVVTASDRQSIQENPTTINQQFELYNWRGEVRFAGQRLVYQGAQSTLDVRVKSNQDSANFLNGRDFYQSTKTHSKIRTHEVRLQSEERLFDRLDYVLGYFNQYQKTQSDLTTETPVLLPAAFGGGLATVATTPISSTPNGPLTQNSFFGNVTLHLGEATELSGGLRHIDSKNPGGNLSIAGNKLPTPGIHDKGWVYTASAKHNITSDLMVYASTGTSRRAGPQVTGDFSIIKSALQQSFQYLPSETSRSYEIGFKSSLFDRRMRLNGTIYHQTFKNYPFRSPTGIYYVNYGATVTNGAVTVTPGVGSFNFVAPVPVEVNGAEGEVSFDILRNWNVGVLASYALGKIKKGTVPCNDLNGDGVPDNLTAPPTLAVLAPVVGANNLSTCKVSQRSSFQSPFTATVQSEFHQPVSDRVDGFLRGLFSYYGKSQGDPQFAYDQVKAYGLLNLFAGIRDPKGAWEVSLFGKNIFNTTKVLTRMSPATTNYQRLSTSFVASAATFTSAYSQVTTTPPQEFGVSVRFALGAR
jgi:iron complex outermembrane receptor protein